MPRFAALASLSCAAFLAAIPGAKAQNPIPATTTVDEQVHRVEVEIARDGATLRVTRTLFNPTLTHAQVDLPIPLPCEALLDDFQVEEAAGAGGSTHWKQAELLSPSEADTRFDAYFASTFDPSITHAGNADSAMRLTRDRWGCEAELSVYPIPPAQQRSVAYRLFIPSVYADGRYTIELPSFDGYGLTPNLDLAGLADAKLVAQVDQRELDDSGTVLDGQRSHTIVLQPRDAGRGHVRVSDLDVDALLASTPAATALLATDAGPQPRLQRASFEAPAELAALPRVRRAVILLDASRSLSDFDRERLQRFGAAYFAALAEHDADVEVLLFDREVRRVYHDFVPAIWAAEDLSKLELETGNGSEVGLAIATARELLAEPTPRAGADWIIVLSDLELRSGFDVDAVREAAEASATRVHVVRQISGGFAPASADDPWTAVARAAGGMAWETHGDVAFADELVSPKRIWNLAIELEHADGSHHTQFLDAYFQAGGLREWSNHAHAPGLSRAAFVGEVWGQRRAWSAAPSELEGRRLAGALATANDAYDLPDAVLTALAFHAQVVSPFSSAWALAEFGGTGPAPLGGLGFGGSFGRSYGCSSRCGGVTRCAGRGRLAPKVDLVALTQQVVARCQPGSDGSFGFETTATEIVAVDSPHRCLAAQTWELDMSPTEWSGRRQVTVSYTGDSVTRVDVRDR